MLGITSTSPIAIRCQKRAVAVHNDLIEFLLSPSSHVPGFDAGDKLSRLERFVITTACGGIGSRDDEVGTFASFARRISRRHQPHRNGRVLWSSAESRLRAAECYQMAGRRAPHRVATPSVRLRQLTRRELEKMRSRVCSEAFKPGQSRGLPSLRPA